MGLFERSKRKEIPIEKFTVRISADSLPQCENCERLAEITASFIKHLQAEEQYLDDILVTLELLKDAFEDKEYEKAEKLLDELITDLKTDKKA